METKFKAGEVVKHKADNRSIVILYPLKKRFFKIQRYKVTWRNIEKGEYSDGIAFETELKANE